MLGLASLLNDVASEMIFPLLDPFVTKVLHGTTAHLGLIEGLADSTASLLKLWSGYWSDRVGRRRGFVIFGYGMAALSRPLMGLLTAPWQVLVIRTSDRIGKGIRAAPRDALIADSTEPSIRGRAFGFHRAMDHLGAAIGPILAFLFLWFFPDSLRTMFLLTLIPGLLVTGLVLFGLRERPAQTRVGTAFSLSLKPFGRDFRLYLLALVVFTLGNSSDIFLLHRAGELGVPTYLLPILWCVFHIAKSGGNLLAGPVVDRIGPRPLIFCGWIVYGIIYLGFGFATSAWHVWGLFLGYAVFYALTEPAEKTLVANLVASENKGTAFGWFNFAIGIASLPASVIFGVIYNQYGALPAFGCSTALALIAAAILTAVRVAK